jgi:hypothetical protein
MSLTTKSIILRTPPPDNTLRDDVERAVQDLNQKHHLEFEYSGVVEHSPGLPVHIWREATHPGVEVRLVLDDVANLRYLSVRSPSRDLDSLQGTLLSELMSRFDVLTLTELREEVRKSRIDQHAWTQLALGLGSTFDEEAAQLVRAALESQDVAERRLAAEAAALLQWPQLTESLTAALDQEPDESLKQMLELAVLVSSAQTDRE